MIIAELPNPQTYSCLGHRSALIYTNSQFGLTDASNERTGERLNRVGLDGVSYIRAQPPRPTRFFTQLG